MKKIEQWDVFETAVQGREDGNPFLDYGVTGTFTDARGSVKVDGFYDGDSTWRVRFMPCRTGKYTYVLEGSALAEKVTGEFEAVSPSEKRHGPVRVVEKTALAYADGTPHYSFGTTCYAWVHQTEELQEQTLKTLAGAPFNKIRFCVFPKYYEFNVREPITHPFERGHGEGLGPALKEKTQEKLDWPGAMNPDYDFGFNYLRPNVRHFQRFDTRIRQLREMGIEADIILFHPYDRWGMNAMGPQACDAYLRYCVARWGAYSNVWWSLANEYDLIFTKTAEDWERYGELITEKDPYGHLLSVHNCLKYYDFSKPWVTHQSLQRIDFYRTTEDTDELLEKVQKPVVWDEICYEGNIGLGWGNITGEELVRRFWEAFLRGGHAGHGETFMDPKDIIWWSHGGVLKGESVPRIAFLRKIMESMPGKFMRAGFHIFDEIAGVPVSGPAEEKPVWFPEDSIHYLGITRPTFRTLYLPEDGEYEVEIIDTWNMTVTPAGTHRGKTRIEMPGNQYMALRVRRKG